MALCHRARSVSRAFTLIELLVVVAIIALLISILLPSLSQAKEQAKRAKCGVNLRSLGQAVQSCYNENREFGPSWDDGEAEGTSPWVLYSWCDVLFDMEYLGNDEAQLCPSDQRPDEPLQIRLNNPPWDRYRAVMQFGRDEDPQRALRTSYGISAPMHFNFYEDRYRDAARQIFAADGWWAWIGGFNASWLGAQRVFGAAPNPAFPSFGAKGMGWRHGRNFSADLLLRDGHVETYTPKLSGLDRNNLLYETTDTARFFTWLPGEFPSRSYTDPYVSPGGRNYAGYAEGFVEQHESTSGGLLPQWRRVQRDGTGGKLIAGTVDNVHPYAYPDELNAVWRTRNNAWKKLPNENADRR